MSMPRVAEICPECGVIFTARSRFERMPDGSAGPENKTCPNGHATRTRILRQQREQRTAGNGDAPQ